MCYNSVLLIFRLFIENEDALNFDPTAAKLGTGAPIELSNLQQYRYDTGSYQQLLIICL